MTTPALDLDSLLEDITAAQGRPQPWEILDPDDLVTAINRLKDLEAEKCGDALMLDSAKSTPTGFDIQMHAGGPKTQEALIFIADSMRSALDEYDAKNYLEMKLRASDGRQYVMTLQRQGGALTPHEAREAAEVRAGVAEAKVAAVREALLDLRENPPMDSTLTHPNGFYLQAGHRGGASIGLRALEDTP